MLSMAGGVPFLPLLPMQPIQILSRTVFSALSGMRLLACLIVAPCQGYDEPGFLSYAIRSFCPTSTDGLQRLACLAFRFTQCGL